MERRRNQVIIAGENDPAFARAPWQAFGLCAPSRFRTLQEALTYRPRHPAQLFIACFDANSEKEQRALEAYCHAHAADRPEIIWIDAEENPASCQRALELKVVAYLVKPICETDLLNAILKGKDAVLAREDQWRYVYNTLIARIRRLYFQNFVETQRLQPPDIDSLNKECETVFREGQFRTVILALNTESLLQEYRELICISFQKLRAEECLYEKVVYDSDRNVVLLLNYAPGGFLSIRQRLAEIFRQLLQYDIPSGITMAIGPETDDMAQVASVHTITKLYVTARISMGCNQVFDSEALKRTNPNYAYLLDAAMERRLATACNSKNIDDIKDATGVLLDSLMQKMKRNPLSITYEVIKILDIYRPSFDILAEAKPGKWGSGKQYYFAKKKNIETAASFEEIYDVFRLIIYDLSTVMQVKRKPHKSRIAVEAIQVYINEHYEEDISLEELAGFVNLNPNYICSIFKKECGVSIKQYLINQRMEAAKRLLRDCRHTVKSVGHKVGYPDNKYFCKQFKKNVGISPSEYRYQLVWQSEEEM